MFYINVLITIEGVTALICQVPILWFWENNVHRFSQSQCRCNLSLRRK